MRYTNLIVSFTRILRNAEREKEEEKNRKRKRRKDKKAAKAIGKTGDSKALLATQGDQDSETDDDLAREDKEVEEALKYFEKMRGNMRNRLADAGNLLASSACAALTLGFRC